MCFRYYGSHDHSVRRAQSTSLRVQIQMILRSSTKILPTPSMPGRNRQLARLSDADIGNIALIYFEHDAKSVERRHFEQDFTALNR